MSAMNKIRAINPVFIVIGIVLLLLAAVLLVFRGDDSKQVTAEFPRAISLYKGSSVRILGVEVGQVDEVTPAGTKVIVKFHYDSKYKVPADAKAAVISPSIVGDRFIQMTPVYTGGKVLASGARLGMDRTATPLELDEIFGSISELTKALGPEGANKPDASGTGALTRLLDSTAKNFGGQGVQFNETLRNLSRLTKTLSDNKDNLFGTLAEVEKFTATLAANDQTVRQFNDSLAAGATLLADERADFAAVLKNLSVALTEVRTFVSENKQLLSTNIKGLNRISKILVKNRAAIDESLTAAPVALNNLMLAYNPTSGSLDTRANVGETVGQLTANPGAVICAFAPNKATCDALKGALGALGLGRTAPGAQRVTELEPIDTTLAGLLPDSDRGEDR